MQDARDTCRSAAGAKRLQEDRPADAFAGHAEAGRCGGSRLILG